MTCGELEQLDLDWVYGELDAPLRAAVAAHVAGCTGCRARLDALQRTLDITRNALRGPLREPSPARVRSAVHEFARQHAPARRGSVLARLRHWLLQPWLVPVLAGATALALVISKRFTAHPEDVQLQEPSERDDMGAMGRKQASAKKAERAEPAAELAVPAAAPAPAPRLNEPERDTSRPQYVPAAPEPEPMLNKAERETPKPQQVPAAPEPEPMSNKAEGDTPRPRQMLAAPEPERAGAARRALGAASEAKRSRASSDAEPSLAASDAERSMAANEGERSMASSGAEPAAAKDHSTRAPAKRAFATPPPPSTRGAVTRGQQIGSGIAQPRGATLDELRQAPGQTWAPSRRSDEPAAAVVEPVAPTPRKASGPAVPVTDARTLNERVARADQAYREGQWDAAAAAYQLLLRDYPTHRAATRWRQRLQHAKASAIAHPTLRAPDQ